MALIQNFSEAKDKIFYLTSAESKILADQIREVKILDKIRVGERDDYALVSIEPVCVLFDQKKFINLEITEFLIGSRHKGFSVFGTNFPVEVYVCTFKKNREINQKEFSADDLNIMAWATLHKNYPHHD